MVTQVFKNLYSPYVKSVKIVYYRTPWTGKWNLYDYNDNNGSTLAAYIGAELLTGKGKKSLLLNSLNLKTARRYFISNKK